jgi:hypothetical protein
VCNDRLRLPASARRGRRIVQNVYARRLVSGATVAAALAFCTALDAQTPADRAPERPRLILRALPSVAIAPARVVFVAELQGGADDFQEYYCPTIAWEWNDDTRSESSADCEPFEAGKTVIRRRYTKEHVFRREGPYKIYFHMKRKDKTIASASAVIQVQPGAFSRDPF